jgi:hypothetical protein
MDDFFELIDLTSGNVVGDFADEEEALTALQRISRRHGRSAIRNLSLMHIDGDSQSEVAMQDQLADMVEGYNRSPTPESAVPFRD